MNVMLFLVLFDQELAEIFREILEKVIGRSFVSIRMDTLAALDIPKSEREKENLRDLISWVAS